MAKSLKLGDISLKAKLSLVVGSLVVALLVNVGFSSYKMNLIGQEITSAAEEQTSVAEEINRNVSNINEATERTNQGARDTSAASEELARMAAGLQDLVNQFKV